MKALIFLSIAKVKGQIRNQFRSISAGFFAAFMVLFYGGLFFLAFKTSADTLTADMIPRITNASLMSFGIIAIMCISMLMNKRKALVFDTDAFYLFAGPFSRIQINGYIFMQTMVQAVVFAFLGGYLYAMVSMGTYYDFGMFLVSFLVFYLISSVFLLLTDYIYMWTLVNRKVQIVNYLIVFCLLFSTAGVFLHSVGKAGFQMKTGFENFAVSKEFYMVPLFGWGKCAMDSYLNGNHATMLLGIGILLLCNLVLAVLFLCFRKDIVEQAVEDSIEASEFMRKARAKKGNSLSGTEKIKKIKGEFPEGAKAIFYKNILQIRKTGNFLRKQDLFIILIYFVISFFMIKEGRFYTFCYMLMIWMFGLLNDEDLIGDLKNYQIYLIPEPPLKKLVYAVIPAYLKVGAVISAAILFAGIFMKMPAWDILQYILMLLGYAMIFVAGTVLSKKVLKTRSNALIENLLRMLLVVVCAIPSLGLGVLSYFILKDLQMVMLAISIITLCMNFLVSGTIIVLCRNMMNGREM